LITGIAGFVGPHLATHLLEAGHTVAGIIKTRADRTIPKRIVESNLIGKVKLTECDITDIYSLSDVMERDKPDWVFHLASQSFVPYSISNPLDTYTTNSTGTTNLLEVLRKRAPQAKLIFAGSSEEYGRQFGRNDWENGLNIQALRSEPRPHVNCIAGIFDDEFPINENNPLRPNTLYGVTKVYGDYMCRTYTKTFGLNTVVSRAFNHEGYGRAPQFVTASIIRQLCAIKAGETTKLHIGDTTAQRDWSHVEDICAGYVLMAESGMLGRVYVQGSGVARSVEDFITAAEEYIKPGVYGIARDVKARPAEIPYLRADPTRIKSELGWAPRKGLTEIIEDLYEYYKIPANRNNLMV
jgi:GDPmannose 4,6-dehydratase